MYAAWGREVSKRFSYNLHKTEFQKRRDFVPKVARYGFTPCSCL
jgi:hypothetical protein